jgi:4-hydroxy-tetrahydrodipicolinate synthase
MKRFQGTGVALVTPFDASGAVDVAALRRLVNLQVAGGTDFLVVQGTTGETPVLSDSEKRQTLDIVLEENNGRLPIVLGVGGNNTLAVSEKLKTYNLEGVDGILSVSPYYNKPSQEGIYQHFLRISESTDKSIILYNVPGRTSSNMLAETSLRLSELTNVVAVKEASGNMEQIMQIIQAAPVDFDVLSGDDALTLPMIAVGAKGVISVVANAYPERFSEMVNAALKEDLPRARTAHYDLLNVTGMFFAEGNPAGVKSALKARGVMHDYLRLPLVNVSLSLDQRIQAETRRILQLSEV